MGISLLIIMKLIIARHGETEELKAGIFQGHLPGRLSKTGIKQAKKVALRLKDEKIGFIYSADLARVSDTAKEIAKFHPNIPIKFVKNLREMYWGEWQGKTRKELGFVGGKSVSDTLPKDAETFEELYNRASKFLHKVLSKHHDDTLLLVGCSGINKALIAVIMGKGPEEMKLIEHPKEASIYVFEIDENWNYKILVFNSTKHLR